MLFRLMLIVISGMFYSGQAAAWCTSTPSLPTTFNAGNLSVTTLLAVGSEVPGSEKEFTLSILCSAEEYQKPINACFMGQKPTWVSGYDAVYESGVEGIGIALKNASGEKIRANMANCGKSTSLGTAANYPTPAAIKLKLVLVKTSNLISNGSINPGQAWGIFIDRDRLPSWPSTVSFTGNVAVKPLTCQVGNGTSMLVKMDKVMASELPTLGSIAGNTDFSIPVTCAGASTVSMTITQPAGTSSGQGLLADLTNKYTGYAIQMLKDGVPVTFGRAYSIGTIPAGGGTLNVPFKLRYYRNNTYDVKPGKVQSYATISMTYQ